MLDGDEDAIEAVEGDLQAMRLDDQLDNHHKGMVIKVLAGVSARALEAGQDAENAAICEATKSIMISPGQPSGWAELAAISGDIYAAEMALVNAVRSIPPRGDVDAEALSKAFAQTSRRGDALQAIMVAPWKSDGWESFAESLSA